MSDRQSISRPAGGRKESGGGSGGKDSSGGRRYKPRSHYGKIQSIDHPNDAFVTDFSGDEYFPESPELQGLTAPGGDSPVVGATAASPIFGSATGSVTPAKKKSSRSSRLPPPTSDPAVLTMRTHGFDLDPRFFNVAGYTTTELVDTPVDWSAVQYVWSFHRSCLPPSSLSPYFSQKEKSAAPAPPPPRPGKSHNSNATGSNKPSITAPTLPLEHAGHCPICLSNPVAAVSTSCGHVYCMPCILELIARSTERYAKCPLCNHEVYEGMLRPYVSLSYVVSNYDHPIKLSLVFRERNSLQSFAVEDFATLQEKCVLDPLLECPFTGPQLVDLFALTANDASKKASSTSQEEAKRSAQQATVTSKLPSHGINRFSRYSFTNDIRPLYQRMRSELIAALNDFRETFEVMQAIEEQKLQEKLQEEEKRLKQAQVAVEQSLTGVWAKRAVARLDGTLNSPTLGAVPTSPPATALTAGQKKTLTGVKLDLENYQDALRNKRSYGYEWDEDPAAIFLKIALDRVDSWISACTSALQRAARDKSQVLDLVTSEKSVSKAKPQAQKQLSESSGSAQTSEMPEKLDVTAAPSASISNTTSESQTTHPASTKEKEGKLSHLRLDAKAAPYVPSSKPLPTPASASPSQPISPSSVHPDDEDASLALALALSREEAQIGTPDHADSGTDHDDEGAEESKGQVNSSKALVAKAQCIDPDVITDYLPVVHTGVSLSQEQLKRRRPTHAPTFVYYQSHSGEALFLHPANMRALLTEFKSLAQLPKNLIARVVGMERQIVTDRERRINPFVSHLPIGAAYLIALVDLDPILSPATKAAHGAELKAVIERAERQKAILAKTDAFMTRKKEAFLHAEFERVKRSASMETLSAEAYEARQLRTLLGEEAARKILAEREAPKFPSLPSPVIPAASPSSSAPAAGRSLSAEQSAAVDSATAAKHPAAPNRSANTPWGNAAARLALSKSQPPKQVGFPSLGHG